VDDSGLNYVMRLSSQNYLAGARFVLNLMGCAFAALSVLSIFYNAIEPVQSPAFWCSLSYLCFALLLGWFASSGGVASLTFLLGLAPALNNAISAIFPLISLPIAINGTTLVVGFVVGESCRRFTTRRSLTQNYPRLASWSLSVQINCFLIFIGISTAVAIARNLWVSGSTASLSSLWFNILHLKLISWHDNYYPLNSAFSFGIAFALVNAVMHGLHGSKNIATSIIKPLLLGVIVSATWGLIQNRTGLGLPHSSASGNRFTQSLGFAATGFQPDIHAFAAHMLIGAVGAWGCLFLPSKQISRLLMALAIVMGWVGLVISKSRGSMILAILVSLGALGVLLFRKSKLYFFATTTVLLFSVLSIYVLHRWGLSIIPLALIQYSESLPKLSINNLATLNEHFGYRLEIYHAALRMFSAFPLMGLGQGEFYHMSSIGAFAQSKFLDRIHGENAHNYFFQVITESGLIGFSLAASIFIKPLMTQGAWRICLSSLFIFASFALGNIFGHSLLVTENLFLLATVLALFCIQVESYNSFTVKTDTLVHIASNRSAITRRASMVFVCALFIFFASREVYLSFGKFPYVQQTSVLQSSLNLVSFNGLSGNGLFS